jgi:hypothetical protein
MNLQTAWPKKTIFTVEQQKMPKTIFFKLCSIDPLPLGAIVTNLQKNQTILIAKIVISQEFNNFCEQLK